MKESDLYVSQRASKKNSAFFCTINWMCFHVGNLGTPSVFQFKEIGNLILQSFCTLIARGFFNVRDWNSGLSTLINLQITRYTNKNIYTKIEFENWIIFFSKDLKGQFNNSDFPSLRCLLSIFTCIIIIRMDTIVSSRTFNTTYHVLMIITIWHPMRDPSMYQTTTGNRRLLTLVADDTDPSDRNHVTRLHWLILHLVYTCRIT